MIVYYTQYYDGRVIPNPPIVKRSRRMPPTLQPVLLEVFAIFPTDFFNCSYCEQPFDNAGIGAEVHQEVKANHPEDIWEMAARLATWF